MKRSIHLQSFRRLPSQAVKISQVAFTRTQVLHPHRPIAQMMSTVVMMLNRTMVATWNMIIRAIKNMTQSQGWDQNMPEWWLVDSRKKKMWGQTRHDRQVCHQVMFSHSSIATLDIEICISSKWQFRQRCISRSTQRSGKTREGLEAEKRAIWIKWHNSSVSLSLAAELACLRCKQSRLYHTLYYKSVRDETLQDIVLTHVDDFLHCGNAEFHQEVIQPLIQWFKARRKAEAEFRYVGIQIS